MAALYHFNPRENKIDAYGRVSGHDVIDTPITTMTNAFMAGKRFNKIIWDKTLTKLRLQGGKIIPVPQNLKFDSFRDDIEGSRFPVGLCFDLDGIYGIDDKDQTDELVGRRLEKVKDVLDCVSAPVLACVARSQTPRTYVPPELVDRLQQIVLALMERRYLCLYTEYFQKELCIMNDQEISRRGKASIANDYRLNAPPPSPNLLFRQATLIDQV